MDRVILHCDLNNFYASVEMLLKPELGGKAVIVAGNPEKRHGIVLAKNQLAKNCGIKTGDTIWQAEQKCPSVVSVPPNFKNYVKYSNLVYNIYCEYTNQVEHFGIDECWLDITGSVKLLGDGPKIANEIRNRVKNEIGLTISIGVSFTKTFAKLGSDYKKPDAVTVITKENYNDIVWPLPVSDMIMVGRKTEEKLRAFGILTLGDLANADRKVLHRKLGIIGDQLINRALGIYQEDVRFNYDIILPKSVSNGTTTSYDMKNIEDAKIVIYALADLVAYRLRDLGLCANNIGISFKDKEFNPYHYSIRLKSCTNDSNILSESCIEILNIKYDFEFLPLRKITIYAYNLEELKNGIQQTFDDKKIVKNTNLNNAIDKIKNKYGYDTIQRGIHLSSDITENLHTDDKFKPFQR